MSKFGIHFVDSISRSSKGFFVHVRNGDIVKNIKSEPGDIVVAALLKSSLIEFKYGEVLKVFDESIWLEELSKEELSLKINDNQLEEKVFSELKQEMSDYYDMLKDCQVEIIKLDKIENEKAFLHVEKLKNKAYYQYARAWNPYYHYNLEKETVWYNGCRDYAELNLGLILASTDLSSINYSLVKSVDLQAGTASILHINDELLKALYIHEDIITKFKELICN